MTRKECEEKILEKLEEIRNIKNQYCGDDIDDYLSLCIFKDYASVFNNQDTKEHKIECFKNGNNPMCSL